MNDKTRARIAGLLIRWARWLLRMPKSATINGPCIHCGEAVEDGIDHAEDCPANTGVYPVRLQEMWPAGPARCDRCGTVLWPGDTYSHITIDESVPLYEVACTGCALLAEISGEEKGR